ncbi:MAG: carbon storage regulator [Chloroflexota bacterium]
MLILTRKAEQGIVIDGNVVLRILAVDGERVKIGVEAPRSITVLREELLTEAADANQAAAARAVDRPALPARLRTLDRQVG